jgi:hypothetical protein
MDGPTNDDSDLPTWPEVLCVLVILPVLAALFLTAVR